MSIFIYNYEPNKETDFNFIIGTTVRKAHKLYPFGYKTHSGLFKILKKKETIFQFVRNADRYNIISLWDFTSRDFSDVVMDNYEKTLKMINNYHTPDKYFKFAFDESKESLESKLEKIEHKKLEKRGRPQVFVNEFFRTNYVVCHFPINPTITDITGKTLQLFNDHLLKAGYELSSFYLGNRLIKISGFFRYKIKIYRFDGGQSLFIQDLKGMSSSELINKNRIIYERDEILYFGVPFTDIVYKDPREQIKKYELIIKNHLEDYNTKLVKSNLVAYFDGYDRFDVGIKKIDILGGENDIRFTSKDKYLTEKINCPISKDNNCFFKCLNIKNVTKFRKKIKTKKLKISKNCMISPRIMSKYILDNLTVIHLYKILNNKLHKIGIIKSDKNKIIEKKYQKKKIQGDKQKSKIFDKSKICMPPSALNKKQNKNIVKLKPKLKHFNLLWEKNHYSLLNISSDKDVGKINQYLNCKNIELKNFFEKFKKTRNHEIDEYLTEKLSSEELDSVKTVARGFIGKKYAFDFETFNNESTNFRHTIYNVGIAKWNKLFYIKRRKIKNIKNYEREKGSATWVEKFNKSYQECEVIKKNDSKYLENTKVFFGEESLDDFIDYLKRKNDESCEIFNEKKSKKVNGEIEKYLTKERFKKYEESNSIFQEIQKNMYFSGKKRKLCENLYYPIEKDSDIEQRQNVFIKIRNLFIKLTNAEIIKSSKFMEKKLQINSKWNNLMKEQRKKLMHRFIGFNNSRYDNFLVLMSKRAHVTSLLKNNGILSLKLWEYIEFVDQYRHTRGSLANLCKSYKVGKKWSKTVFPHELANKLGWKLVNYECDMKQLKWYDFSKFIEDGKEKLKQFKKEYSEKKFNFRDISIHYQKLDCISLLILRENYASEMLKEYGVKVGGFLTISSISGHLTKKYLSKNFKNKSKVWVIKNYIIDKFIKEAIYGGFVSPIKLFYESHDRPKYKHLKKAEEYTLDEYNKMIDFLVDIDAVSLYPSAMSLFAYPVGKPKIIKKMKTLEIIRKNLNSGKQMEKMFICMCDIKYKRPKGEKNDLIIPILCEKEKVNGTLKNIYDLTKKEKVVYDNIKLEDAIKYSKGGHQITKIHMMIMWPKKEFIFKEFIDQMFENRLKAKKVGDILKSNILKLVMNSVYGKLIQRIFGVRDEITSDNELIDELILSDRLKTFELCSNEKNEQRAFIRYDIISDKNERITNLPYLGVFVLSYSKRIMYDAMNQFDAFYDWERTIHYSDTDSMQTRNKEYELLKKKISPFTGKSYIGKGLGQFHNDIEDLEKPKIIYSIRNAPKNYIMHYVGYNIIPFLNFTQRKEKSIKKKYLGDYQKLYWNFIHNRINEKNKKNKIILKGLKEYVNIKKLPKIKICSKNHIRAKGLIYKKAKCLTVEDFQKMLFEKKIFEYDDISLFRKKYGNFGIETEYNIKKSLNKVFFSARTLDEDSPEYRTHLKKEHAVPLDPSATSFSNI